MLKLIEAELMTARGKAEYVVERRDDGFLGHLIDMAILEAKQRVRSHGDVRGTATEGTRCAARDDASHHDRNG